MSAPSSSRIEAPALAAALARRHGWKLLAALAVLALGAFELGTARATPAPGLTVAAASSMRTAMPALLERFEGGPTPGRVSYGASGDLRSQVEAGAPIDAVVFASASPMEALRQKGHVRPEDGVVVATNRLVLIGPKGATPLTFQTLDSLAPTERLAVGDPGAVPAGQYAVEALQRLGKWERLRGQLVYGADVAAVLAFARRGEVAAAIVYATDVQGVPDVVRLDEAVGSWAPKPVVVAAPLVGARDERARRFVDFLRGQEGQAVLRRFGFGPP